MRVRRLHPAWPLLVAFASPADGAGFDLAGQTRDVGVTITESTLTCRPPPTGCSVGSSTNHGDSESAPDFSPFAAIASVLPFTTVFATQDSVLSAASLVAQGSGSHSGSGALTTPPNIYTVVESSSATLHRISFDVATATPYRLSGSVRSTGGLSANSTTRITFEISGGAPLAEVLAATDPNCQDPGCATVGPLPVASYGVLAPGSYVLEVEARVAASPFYFANEFLSLTSTWEYDVHLDTVQVSAHSSAGLVLLALACTLAAWPALLRLRRVRG